MSTKWHAMEWSVEVAGCGLVIVQSGKPHKFEYNGWDYVLFVYLPGRAQ